MFHLLMLSKLEAVLSNALDLSSFSRAELIAFLSAKEFFEQLPVFLHRPSTLPIRILADALRLFAGKTCLALSAALFWGVASQLNLSHSWQTLMDLLAKVAWIALTSSQ